MTNKAQLVNFDPTQVAALGAGYAAVYDFLRFARDLRLRGEKVLITLAPSEVQVDPALRARLAEHYQLDLAGHDWSLPARTIRATSAEVDPHLPVIDLTGYFQCRNAAGERLYHPRNTHWNLAGNALAGEIIASYILQNWLSVSAPLPQDLQACLAEKEREESQTSAAAIHTFVAEKILPKVGNGVE